MVKETISVTSALGLHLRPSGAMCEEAVKYKSSITFQYAQGKTANAKSVISILSAGVKCGGQIELMADGDDEEEALAAVSKVLKEALKDD